jgi:DNA topoisomerase IB
MFFLSHTARRIITLDRADLTGGNWVTIHGARVYIRDGTVAAGPSHLIGKTPDEIASHGNAPTETRPGFTPIERDAAGNYLGDNAEHAERLKAMKLEPGLSNVHLNNDPNAELQVVGTDSKGRSQRKYSADHSETAAVAKFERVKNLVDKLPEIREKIANDPSEEAAVLRLVDKTGFRVGSDRDTGAEKQAYGATTLLGKHIKTKGGKTFAQFTGKKGVAIKQEITDPAIAADLQKRAAAGGKLFNTTDSKVRDYFHTIAPGFKVKDLRTAVAAEQADKDDE